MKLHVQLNNYMLCALWIHMSTSAHGGWPTHRVQTVFSQKNAQNWFVFLCTKCPEDGPQIKGEIFHYMYDVIPFDCYYRLGFWVFILRKI